MLTKNVNFNTWKFCALLLLTFCMAEFAFVLNFNTCTLIGDSDSVVQQALPMRFRRQTIGVAQLQSILWRECNGRPAKHDDFLIDVGKGGHNTVMLFNEYKRWQAEEFIKTKANPGPKGETPLKLSNFSDVVRPDPKTVLQYWWEDINIANVEFDVGKEQQARLNVGDDDVLKIPEVREEVVDPSYKVPNLVHFVWFGCRRLRVDQYMAILGALKYQDPRLILIHGNCTPSGEYWDHLKKQGGDKIRLIQRTPPERIWGIPIKVIEHQADVARLQIMIEVGGMYLDTDSVVLRNLDQLRNYSMVLPEKDHRCLENSVIFANRNAWFLRRWYHEYKYFQDDEWDHNSVKVPWALWRIFPDEIHVVKELISRPNRKEVKLIYHELYDWHRNYIVHLYTRFLKDMDKTDEHTLKELAILNTTYGQISRHILWGDERARDITDWVVSCNRTHGLTT